MREEATFEVVDYTAPNGREFQFLRHMIANHSSPRGSDARLLIDDWVTITPLRPQLTADDLLEGRAPRSAPTRARAAPPSQRASD